MELTREDFETVLIAEGGWGPVDRTVAKENPNLFQCEGCSTKTHAVFHNVRGEHKHMSDLTQRIEQQFF